MENKKISYETNDNYPYKEYNIKKNSIIFYLRIEISKNNINFIAKELNSSLDYNYKIQDELINLIKKLDISEKDCSNYDLIFKKFTEILENKNILISKYDHGLIIKIIIKNEKSNNNYEIKLSKEKMKYDDKLNLLYSHIKMINNNNCEEKLNAELNNNLDIKNIIQRIDNTNLDINKKEDDIKNIINENIEKIIKEQKNFIENINKKFKNIENDLNKIKNDFENKINNLYIIDGKVEYIKESFFTKIELKKKFLPKKEKNVYKYFGYFPENELNSFFNNFKKALLFNVKKGDKKKVKIKIKGTEEYINSGSSIEMFIFDPNIYGDMVDTSKDYTKRALSIFTFSLSSKIPNHFQSGYLESIKTILQKLNLSEKNEIYLNYNGKKIILDIVNLTGGFVVQLFNIINLNEFNEFNCLIKSEFCFNDIFSLSIEKLILKLSKTILDLNGYTESINYILNSFFDGLKELNLNRPEKLKVIKDYIFFLKRFLSFSFDLQLDLKNFFKLIIDKLKNNLINKKWLSSSIESNLEIYELFKLFKDFSIEEISISIAIPQYKNGFAFIGKFPGLKKFIDNLI